MEEFKENNIKTSDINKLYFKPEYQNMFKKIKEIKRNVKNEILVALLNGQWHSELELIRIAKKQPSLKHLGAVTLGTIVGSLNHNISSNYLEKTVINGKLYYRISQNYVGLSRAAYFKYRPKL